MKKVFFALITLCLLSCEVTKKTIAFGSEELLKSIKTQTVQTTTMLSADSAYTSGQFDNFCLQRNVPRDISKWAVVPLKDYESGEVKSKYLYMTSQNSVYVMTLNVNEKNDTTFNVTTRLEH